MSSTVTMPSSLPSESMTGSVLRSYFLKMSIAVRRVVGRPQRDERAVVDLGDPRRHRARARISRMRTSSISLPRSSVT